MYSKERGYTYRIQDTMGRRSPSYRQPERPRMQVPPNYSGHAIVDGEERPLGQLPEAEAAVGGELPGETPVPTFAHVPRVSELGAPARPRPEEGMAVTESPSVREAPSMKEAPSVREASSVGEEPPTRKAPSVVEAEGIPVSSRPSPSPLWSLSHFPFGHGLGFEELLLLGLILFLLHESNDCAERGDLDETVILLGLLLLLG